MEPVRAVSPGHITGFFSIRDQDSDPLKKGSLGAGFCLGPGVVTTLTPRPHPEDSILINGAEVPGAPVSRAVLRIFYDRTGLERSRGFLVNHEIPLPLGSGFGTSGAGALSLSLALNSHHGDPLSREKAAQVAHLAEIEARTGLGTVIGETFGGGEIRVRAGAPGVGELRAFPLPRDRKALLLVRGPLPTASMLGDPLVRSRVNEAGEALLGPLLDRPDWETFLVLSAEFSRKTGLLTPRLRQLLDRVPPGLPPLGMLMFGEGLFTMAHSDEIPAFQKAWEPLEDPERMIILELENQGGRLDSH